MPLDTCTRCFSANLGLRSTIAQFLHVLQRIFIFFFSELDWGLRLFILFISTQNKHYMTGLSQIWMISFCAVMNYMVRSFSLYTNFYLDILANIFLQGPDFRPLWLLVGTPSVIRPELAFSRAEHSLPFSDVTIYIFAILYLSSMLYVYRFLLPLRLGLLLVCCLYKEVYLQIFKRVSFWLHGCCGEWEGWARKLG